VADAFESAFAAATKEHPGALFVLFDPLLFANRTRIADFANANRLPAMTPHREYAESGILMSYGANLPDMFRRAAGYVDKILKGAKPGDLPVEQPTTFELIINLKAAKALGLTIPSTLLFQADEVIQ
jgi:putative ABC transport system substrate-binding protein